MSNLIKTFSQKRTALIIGIFVVLILSVILFFKILSPSSLATKITPTPTPTEQKNIRLGSLPILYNKEKVKQAENLLVNRKILQPTDQQIKDRIIREKNPLYSDNYVSIMYLPQQDAFHTEIHTVRISTAKDVTATWFKAKGFSEQAICDLPVIFSINERNAEKLRETHIVFDPLPPGC